MSNRLVCNALCLLLWGLTIPLLQAAEPDAAQWPQFRGLNAAGTSDAKTVPTEIAPTKNVLWKVDLPAGASSPAIWGDKIFVTAYDQDKLWTLCLNRADGKELWRREAPAAKIEDYHHSEGSPAASTPALTADRVVSYFGSCGLFCHDHAGNLQWKLDFPRAETLAKFGSGTSPIVAGDVIYLARDVVQNPEVLAIELASGKVRWRKPRPHSPSAYSTPVIWKHAQGTDLVVAGVGKMNGYDPVSGDERWAVNIGPATSCTTPLATPELLFFAGWSPGSASDPSSAFPKFADLLTGMDKDKDGKLSRPEVAASPFGNFFDNNDTDGDGFIESEEWDALIKFTQVGKNIAMAIKPGGKGDITESHVVWTQNKNLPYVPSPVIVNGKLLIVKDGGIATVFEPASGKILLKSERIGASGSYYSSPIAIGDVVYMASLDGVVSTVRVGDKFELLHRGTFGERISATPAVADGKLYLRTATALYAFGSETK
jgi:outer membrane protein assembly factor BamB